DPRRRVVMAVGVAAIVVLAAAGVIAGLTIAAMQPQQQHGLTRFCFAEWCIQPVAARTASDQTFVDVRVASTARAASQRPDHPPAWLTDSRGHSAGGPQSLLEREVGPGETYSARLVFAGAVSGCADFVVAEGAWLPFLGLGYAPSPFTERASWRICLG